MTDRPSHHEPARTAGPRGRRYRRHAIELADGGRLVLGVDGTIERTDAAGTATHTWGTDDPEWPGQAIRFGLRPQATTVAPHGRRDQGPKSPG